MKSAIPLPCSEADVVGTGVRLRAEGSGRRNQDTEGQAALRTHRIPPSQQTYTYGTFIACMDEDRSTRAVMRLIPRVTWVVSAQLELSPPGSKPHTRPAACLPSRPCGHGQDWLNSLRSLPGPQRWPALCAPSPAQCPTGFSAPLPSSRREPAGPRGRELGLPSQTVAQPI